MNNLKKTLLSYLFIFIVTFIGVKIFTNFIITPIIVSGNSMYPTLEDKEFGFSSIISARLGEIKRFDIVVINIDKQDKRIVKRVIGLPNETMEYLGDSLYINGEYIEEEYLNNDHFNKFITENKTQFTDDFKITLGEDEYFCMGDNRPFSGDSRELGPFNKSEFFSTNAYILF